MDTPPDVPVESKPPEPARSHAPSLEVYQLILTGIHQQIRFADAKAGFIAALHAILFGFLATHVDNALVAYAKAGGPALWSVIVFQALYLIAMALAVGAVIWAIKPRFKELSPDGKVFFGHIVKHYGTDYQKYVRDTSTLTDQQWADELGAQIVEISHIALAKHRLVRQAVWFTLLAFILWRLSLMSIAYLQASQLT